MTSDTPWAQDVVYQTINEFFHHYLVERDIENALSMLSEQFYSIGTGDDEIAIGKDAFHELVCAEIGVLPDPIQYEMEDYIQKQRLINCWDFFCKMNMRILIPDGYEVFYHTRLTGSVHKDSCGYIIDTLHLSEASQHQSEGEFFPIQFVSEEMNRLNRQTQQELMELITQIMPGGILGGYLKEGFPLYIINEHMLELLGYDTYEEFLEVTHGLLAESIHPDDLNFVQEKVDECQELSDQYEVEYRIKKKNGEYIWVYDVGRKTVTVDGQDAIISVLIDISEQVRIKQNLKDESVTDMLTNIYNRKGGQERIIHQLPTAEPYIFLMIDLDNFKKLNDIYGHRSGDEVLCYIAQELKKVFRKGDTVCRLGGDEFAVFMPNTSYSKEIENKVSTIIEKYAEMIQQKYYKSNSTVSIGGVHGTKRYSFSELYQLADEVLYEIKNTKKGIYKICELPCS